MLGVHQAGSNILKDLPFVWVGLKPSTYRWLMIILGSIIPKSLSNLIQISSFSDVAPKFSQNYPYETVAALHWLKGIYAIYLDLPHVWWQKRISVWFFRIQRYYEIILLILPFFFRMFVVRITHYHYQKHNFSPVGISVCLKTRYPQTLLNHHFGHFPLIYHQFPWFSTDFP